MPYFDDSKVVFPRNPSPTKAYHSYMCPSKRDYLNKSTGTENSTDKTTWVIPQIRTTQDKCLQQNISKLRDILSETIASLTRENNLKKGESVELTLEIELMKSIENTPTSSLVEVTIVQHNNKHESNNKLNKIPNKMLFKIEQDKPLTNESSLQKQQTWFKSVISRENTGSNPSRDPRNKAEQHEHGAHRKHIHKPLFCPTANQRFNELNNPAIYNASGHLKNILAEETTHNGNVSLGYQKISQKESRQDPIDGTVATKVHSKKLSKKSSLIKKVSEIFLLPKKPSKNEAVKTALTALKNEIDSMNTAIEEKDNYKHSKKRDKTPVHNLGKLVNNILFDVMASMDGEDQNKIKEELSLPLQYQSFFEPVKRTNKKHRKITKRKISPSVHKLYRSHSDTCCVRPLKSEIEPRLKSSHSITGYKAHEETVTPPEAELVGDTKHTHTKRKKKSNQRDYSRGRKRNLKDDRSILPHTKAEDDPKRHLPHQKAVFSRSSLIQWNGRYVRVSKDIKARIEMLIVNELENLALKEGMECDVTPLSSTDNTSKDSDTVNKVSSFICKLDISDKNVRKIIKKKKSLHTKVSVHHYPKEIIKMDDYKTTHKERTNTTMAPSDTQTVPSFGKETKKNSNNLDYNEPVTIKNEVTTHYMTNYDRDSMSANTSDVEQNSVEIKYMNKNVQNWSAESQTVTFYNPEMTMTTQPNAMCECNSKSIKNHKNNKYISTGFVKVIQSDDSAWNKCHEQNDDTRYNRQITTQDLPTNFNTTGKISCATGKSSSKTSNELDSSIEIELDIQDLEYILKEAKQNYKANKVLIEAKCVCPRKKRRSIKLPEKNSPSYTNQLLSNAANKLEKYAKTKSRSKK